MEPNSNITNNTQDKQQNDKSPSQTSTPQRRVNPPYKQQQQLNSESTDDISKLKGKIIEQATRLTTLEKYKSFCEARIFQLTPTQQFPLNEANLVQCESDPDKKQMMSALRKETLLNEQQRNYIELLKETVENNLFKSGFAGLVQSSNQYQTYMSDKGSMATLADFMVDFSNCRREIEGLKHDLNIKSNLLIDKSQEILHLNKKIEDITIEASLSKETSQREKNKIDQMAKGMNDLIEEKTEMIKEINAIKKENQSLRTTVNDFQSLNKTNERKIQNQSGKIEEMAFEYNEFQNQKTLIKQYEDKIDSLNFAYSQISKEQKESLNDITQLKEMIDKKSIDVTNLKEAIKANESEHQKERRSLISLSNEHELNKKKAESKNNELNKEISHNHNFISDLNSQLSLRDNQLASLEEQLHDSQLKCKEIYLQMTSISEQSEKRQNEAKEYSTQLGTKLESLREENHSIKETVLQMANDSSIKSADYNALKKECDDSKLAMKNLSDEFNKIFAQYQQSQNERNKSSNEKNAFAKESKYWKEKYERDMNGKDNEIRNFCANIEEDKKNESVLVKEIEKSNKSNEALMKALKERCDKEMVLLSQMNKLKQMNDTLAQANTKAKEDIQIEKINLSDLINKNAEIDNQCTELIETNRQLLDDRKLILSDLNNSKQTIKERNNILTELSSVVSSKKNKLRVLNCNSEALNAFLSAPSNSNSNPNSNANDIKEFLTLSSNEIERLTSIVIRLEEELNENNLQLNLISTEKKLIESQYQDTRVTYNDILSANKELKEVRSDLQHQVSQYKESLDSFKKLSRNQENDLSAKISMLTNASYQIDTYEDKVMLLENEKAYLETIILRMCKMFPNANLLQIVQTIIDLNYEIAEIQYKKTSTSQTNESHAYLRNYLEEKLKDKEYQNDILLQELKRAEDYLKVIKDNSLEAQYLNQQLTRKLMEYQYQTGQSKEAFKNNNF